MIRSKRRLFIAFIISVFITSFSTAQSSCANAVVLTPETQQCGNSSGNSGDFPSDGSSPVNPCSVNHNDDEYWFTYTPGAGVAQCNLTLSSISTFFTGLFVFDDCPSDSPSCIVHDVNLASTTDISISFPISNGTTYKIAIITFGPPDGSSFCLDSEEITCTPPTVSLLPIPLDSMDCPNFMDYSFLIDDMGDSQFLTISAEDGLGNQAGIGGVANSDGIFTITDIPVPQTDWNIIITHEDEPFCDLELGPFGFDCPEVNDDLCDAIEIIVNANFITGSNEVSGAESGEPEGGCWGFNPTVNSVWYTFVAPATESVTVSTDYPSTSLDDTHLAVYSFTDCGDMSTLVELGCDDNSGVNGSFGYTSVVNVYNLTSGETYAVQVDGGSSDVGEFNISVKDLIPDHDDCNNAKFLENQGGAAGNASLNDEYFAGATPSAYGTAVCDNGSTVDPNDVWFAVGLIGGTLTVTADPGPNSDIVLSVYSGCFPQLFQSCSDSGNDGGSEMLTYNTSSGFEIVYFRLYEKNVSGEPFDISVSASALPITLLSFEANVETRGNQLLWSTSSEINSDYVEVQSSSDGITNWKVFGSVDTKGESSSRVDYEYFDFNPYSVTYYRLNAVDKDGKAELSRIINVKRSDVLGKLELSPNPASTDITVQTSLAFETAGTITVLDMTGKVVKYETVNLRQGLNTINLDLDNLQSGLYLFTLKTDEGLQVEKFVKQ